VAVGVVAAELVGVTSDGTGPEAEHAEATITNSSDATRRASFIDHKSLGRVDPAVRRTAV
jgi:hypothetical protein